MKRPTPNPYLGGAMKTRHIERIMLRHQWVRDAIGCTGETALSLLLWPRYFAPYRWQLTRYAMAFPQLPAAFEGYKVLFISDLHVGRARQSYVLEVLRAAVAQKPDLILVGGDLIDYTRQALHRIGEVLDVLRAPDGAFTIFGNHDYREYSWRHIGKRSAQRHIHRKLVDAVTQSPVRLLRNEAATVTRDGAKLQIIGIDEMWADRADPAKAFADADPSAPTICLQHNPDGHEWLTSRPWQWMLCGHSHGGQVAFPLLGPLFVPMKHKEWVRGFYEFPAGDGGRQVMFVSCGIGHSEPLRFRVPPEATLFTLTRGQPRGGAALAQ